MKKKLLSILLSLTMCSAFCSPLAVNAEDIQVVPTEAPNSVTNTTAYSIGFKQTTIEQFGKDSSGSAKIKYNPGSQVISVSVCYSKDAAETVVSDANEITAGEKFEKGTSDSIEWSSSKDEVAEVSGSGKNAKIAINGAGTATIKAKSELLGKTASLEVNVGKRNLRVVSGTGLSFESSNWYKDLAAFKTALGKTKKNKELPNLVAKDGGKDLTAGTDFSVAVSGSSISGGSVVALKLTGKGNYDGETYLSDAKVNFWPQNIKFTKTQQTITFGGEATDEMIKQVKYDGRSADDLSGLKLSFKNDKKDVVSVDKQGNIKPKKVGTANITIVPKQNKDAKCEKYVVTVTAKAITDQEAFTFDPEKNIKFKKSYKDWKTFKEKFLNSAAKNFTIKFGKKKMKATKDFDVTIKSQSSISKVADLNNAKNEVTFYIKGKGNFTATKTAVVAIPFEAQSLALVKTGATITYGDTYNLAEQAINEETTFELCTANTENSKKVKYTPADKTIAKVNGKGVVTTKNAKEAGLKITITSKANPDAKKDFILKIEKRAIDDTFVTKAKVKSKGTPSEVKGAFSAKSLSLKDPNTGKKMKADTDYKISNVQAKDGSVTCNITGTGTKYTGTIENYSCGSFTDTTPQKTN